MYNVIENWLIGSGVSETFAEYVAWFLLALAVIAVAMVVKLITRRVVLTAISYFVKRTRTTWDDSLENHKFFNRLAHLAPALIVYFGASLFGPAVGSSVLSSAPSTISITPFLFRARNRSRGTSSWCASSFLFFSVLSRWRR